MAKPYSSMKTKDKTDVLHDTMMVVLAAEATHPTARSEPSKRPPLASSCVPRRNAPLHF